MTTTDRQLTNQQVNIVDILYRAMEGGRQRFAILWKVSEEMGGVVWLGMVWYGMVCYGMVWYGIVCYGMVWYGMLWYGRVWYGMVG